MRQCWTNGRLPGRDPARMAVLAVTVISKYHDQPGLAHRGRKVSDLQSFRSKAKKQVPDDWDGKAQEICGSIRPLDSQAEYRATVETTSRLH